MTIKESLITLVDPSVSAILTQFFSTLNIPHIKIGYLGWRLFGGFRSNLESQEINLNENVIMSVKEERVYYISQNQLPIDQPISDGNVIVNLSKPLHVKLKKTSSNQVELRINFKRLFKMKLVDIYYACCGRYPIAEATYLAQTFGGDPMCGGGLKKILPSPIKEGVEQLKLNKIIDNSHINAQIEMMKEGNAVFWTYENFEDDTIYGHIDILMGLVDEYVQEENKKIQDKNEWEKERYGHAGRLEEEIKVEPFELIVE